tara:strand:- start:427 stop:657 length:231 start_codon:yes stop_codon:yes gene_type:complete
MKKIFISLVLILSFSCSNLPFLENDAEKIKETKADPERAYIDLQIKMHSAYSLFKALRAGVITQEDYDMLKKDVFN